jgi:hypothetical protein
MNEKASKPDLKVVTTGGKKKARSPAYPFVGLKKAIERAGEIYAKENKHPARFQQVAEHWGFKASSSGAMQTVAALRQFGLVTFEGDGVAENRLVRLTDGAIRILLDERPVERQAAIEQAALKPKLYQELWTKYGAQLPSDPTILSYLKVDRGFNPGAVDAVLKAYKDTLAFAKPSENATLSETSEDESEDSDEDQDPMEQVAHAKQQEGQLPAGSVKVPPVSPGKEEEYFRAKLAGGRTVRLLFSGEPPTQTEITKLIAMLELNKDQFPE